MIVDKTVGLKTQYGKPWGMGKSCELGVLQLVLIAHDRGG